MAKEVACGHLQSVAQACPSTLLVASRCLYSVDCSPACEGWGTLMDQRGSTGTVGSR